MKTQVLTPTPKNLKKLSQALARGQLVAIPTETVYGLGGVLWDEKAVLQIFKSKERPEFDPLIAHIPRLKPQSLPEYFIKTGLVDWQAMSKLAQARVLSLAQRFWPGPLTLVLPKTLRVPDLVTSGLPTVGVRMPKHPVTQILLKILGEPLAAPSANRFGKTSPTTAADVLKELSGKIPWILDGGACAVGLESSVVWVDPDSGALSLLRPGGLPREALELLTSEPLGDAQAFFNQKAKLAPGMVPTHYAPSKPFFRLPASLSVILTDPTFKGTLQQMRTALVASPEALSVGLLAFDFQGPEVEQAFEKVFQKKLLWISLPSKPQWQKAARELFKSIRTLDEAPCFPLFCEPVSTDQGLAHAIANRLDRASQILA